MAATHATQFSPQEIVAKRLDMIEMTHTLALMISNIMLVYDCDLLCVVTNLRH